MNASFWWSWWKRAAASSRRGGNKPRRLELECLEGRIVPASSLTIQAGAVGTGTQDAHFLAANQILVNDPDIGANTLSTGALMAASANSDIRLEAVGTIAVKGLGGQLVLPTAAGHSVFLESTSGAIAFAGNGDGLTAAGQILLTAATDLAVSNLTGNNVGLRAGGSIAIAPGATLKGCGGLIAGANLTLPKTSVIDVGSGLLTMIGGLNGQGGIITVAGTLVSGSIQIDGGTGADTFHLHATLTNGNTVVVLGLDGSDAFHATPSATASYYIIGGAPTSFDPGPGDALYLDITDALNPVQTTNQWTFANRKAVQFDYIEIQQQTTTSQRFVSQLYRDLLQRAPDAPGLANWTGYLDGLVAGGMAEAAAQAKVVYAVETNGGHEYYYNLVTGFYRLYLGRGVHASDGASPAAFVNFLAAAATGPAETHKAITALRAIFTGGPEYYFRHGSDPAAFVGGLYQDGLHRGIVGDAGAADVIGALTRGAATREQAANGVFFSAEYCDALVAESYVRLLRRPVNGAISSDAQRAAKLAAQLRAGQSEEAMIADLIASAGLEYYDHAAF